MTTVHLLLEINNALNPFLKHQNHFCERPKYQDVQLNKNIYETIIYLFLKLQILRR